MKVTLDHVGIAVGDLSAALAFFRDGLGLEVQETEEVGSQRVRAHIVPAGGSALELLEATAPDSPIARYLEKQGPGLHHITLRVEDLEEALAHLRHRGVRLIDDRPRPGAQGSLVAFVHPSSAHGVLVELKQAESAGRRHAAHDAASLQAARTAGGVQEALPLRLTARIMLGEFELISLSDGFFHLDGGAMFGVVPKTLWGRYTPADARNRIRLGLRPLIVRHARGGRTLLVDAGVGDKMPPKLAEIYGLARERHLAHALEEAGLAVDDIDIVLASHLHFDHAGGFTRVDERGIVCPRFPRAEYVVRRGEWEDALAPSARTRASYMAHDFAPLAEAGVLRLIDDDETVAPGVRVSRTGGHTRDHQMVFIESAGLTAVFAADLIPTTAHLSDPWILGYDLYPVETLAAKQAFVPEAIARQHLVFFEHDPEIAAGYIREQDGRRTVERVL